MEAAEALDGLEDKVLGLALVEAAGAQLQRLEAALSWPHLAPAQNLSKCFTCQSVEPHTCGVWVDIRGVSTRGR